MTDAARTPATPPAAPSDNIPAQFLALAKIINRATANPDYPGAGVTITRTNTAITVTATLAIERTDEPDGERITVVNFL